GPGRKERRCRWTPLDLLAPRHSGVRRRARRWQRVSQFDEVMGDAEIRSDTRVRLRTRPSCGGFRGLWFPSLGACRLPGPRAGDLDAGWGCPQELQPPARAGAGAGARIARRARLSVRCADRDRARDRWVAVVVSPGGGGYVGQGG